MTPPDPARSPRSGPLEVGQVLLMVGAGLSVASAFLLLVSWLQSLWTPLLVLSLLSALSAVLGARTWFLLREGDVRLAFWTALVAAVVGLQALSLVGAILVRVSPEARQPWRPAPGGGFLVTR